MLHVAQTAWYVATATATQYVVSCLWYVAGVDHSPGKGEGHRRHPIVDHPLDRLLDARYSELLPEPLACRSDQSILRISMPMI
jgi:hypothetical protein